MTIFVRNYWELLLLRLLTGISLGGIFPLVGARPLTLSPCSSYPSIVKHDLLSTRNAPDRFALRATETHGCGCAGVQPAWRLLQPAPARLCGGSGADSDGRRHVAGAAHGGRARCANVNVAVSMWDRQLCTPADGRARLLRQRSGGYGMPVFSCHAMQSPSLLCPLAGSSPLRPTTSCPLPGDHLPDKCFEPITCVRVHVQARHGAGAGHLWSSRCRRCCWRSSRGIPWRSRSAASPRPPSR